MSASDTNVARQRRRHAVPIGGIVLAVLFGLLMASALLFTSFEEPETTEAPAAAVSEDL